jgi:uncharacterized phiE125 gp8 family phage protein
VIAAAYSLVGTAVDVQGYNVVVNLNSGTNGAGGTVDVKLQDSDDNATYTDVVSGAFTQVTEANDNAVQEKAYTGGKCYLKVVCTVATATCDFGVDILKYAPYSTEDTLISGYIKAAREDCESFQNRSYINRTYELWLDEFPSKDYIELPMPPLVSVTSLDIYDTSNVKTSDTTLTDYFIDTKSEPGKLCLAYGKSWPSTTLRPNNGVCVVYTAGYGATSASVPQNVILAMLLLITAAYEHRSGKELDQSIKAAESLLWKERVL